MICLGIGYYFRQRKNFENLLVFDEATATDCYQSVHFLQDTISALLSDLLHQVLPFCGPACLRLAHDVAYVEISSDRTLVLPRLVYRMS